MSRGFRRRCSRLVGRCVSGMERGGRPSFVGWRAWGRGNEGKKEYLRDRRGCISERRSSRFRWRRMNLYRCMRCRWIDIRRGERSGSLPGRRGVSELDLMQELRGGKEISYSAWWDLCPCLIYRAQEQRREYEE